VEPSIPPAIRPVAASESDAAGEVLRIERAASLTATLTLRLLVCLLFLATLLLSKAAPDAPGGRVMVPVALLATLSAVALFGRRRLPLRWAALAGALLDPLVVTMALWERLGDSPNPARTAVFSVGLFAVVLPLSALSFRTEALVTATLTSASGAALLLSRAGVSAPIQALGLVTVVAVAAGLGELTRRARRMMSRLERLHDAHMAELQHAAQEETARRTAEARLDASEARNERLRQMQQDKDALSQLLVHDLRVPLTVAAGHLQIISSYLERSRVNGGPVRSVAEAQSSLERVNGMVGDILQLARLESGQLQLQRAPLDAARLLRQVERQTRSLLGERPVQLLADVQGDGQLEADERLLRRVLENLTSNAVRYTPDGKRLRLLVRLSALEAEIAVQNDGPAIPPERREVLFDKYQQDRPDRGGWGLGLYFCRLATEAHGGRIAIEDRDDYPTSFVVRIPVAQMPAARA